MDQSIRRRIANDDLTYEEAEELEWQKQEAMLDRDLVGVPGIGSPTVQGLGRVNIIPESPQWSESQLKDIRSRIAKPLMLSRISHGINPVFQQEFAPFKEES